MLKKLTRNWKTKEDGQDVARPEPSGDTSKTGPSTATGTDRKMRVLYGVAVSPGYGEGVAFPYRRKEYLFSTAASSTSDAGAAVEQRRLDRAREAARREIEALARSLHANYALNEAHIFHAHFLILEDDLFNGLIRDRIANGRSAEAAVVDAVRDIEQQFQQQVNPYLRERSIDVHDVGSRLLGHLMDQQHHPFRQLPDDAVIAADELLPSDTVFLQRGRVRGIVTAQGSTTSHAAILARAFGIPAVTEVTEILDACRAGDPIAVDGEAGRVILNIEGSAQADYARQARGYRVAVEEIRANTGGVVATVDGVEIRLEANIDREDDIDAAVHRAAAGIGLLRTEFLYMTEGGEATEQRQEEIFRDAARCMADFHVTIRIFDVAPDKALPLSGDSPVASAAIPDCGVRYALAHPEILRPQVRAILRASSVGNLRILLPGVTGVSEIDAFRQLLCAVAGELGVAANVPIGAMIETPSALFMLGDIAEETDFLSLGTNDLLCHLFGRPRQRVLESAFEPSLLHAIDLAVKTANSKKRPIAICGELAGDPAFTAVLIGLGLRNFSMSPERIPEVRYNVSRLRADDCSAMAREILELRSADEVRHRMLSDSDPWHLLLRRRITEDTGP